MSRKDAQTDKYQRKKQYDRFLAQVRCTALLPSKGGEGKRRDGGKRAEGGRTTEAAVVHQRGRS